MAENRHIAEFWSWFTAHASQIHDAYRSDDINWLNETISPRIDRLGSQLDWELGPYNEPDNTLVISPTIRENLPLTRAIVAHAPVIEGWHFLYAKPPKQLTSLVFSARGNAINADEWRHRLTAYNGGEFVDIDILINADPGDPADLGNLFCELVVEALIGEELRLDRVGYLTPHVVDNNTTVEHSTSIKHLRDHLFSVLT